MNVSSEKTRHASRLLKIISWVAAMHINCSKESFYTLDRISIFALGKFEIFQFQWRKIWLLLKKNVREKQRFSSTKTEILGGHIHAPAAQFFSAVGLRCFEVKRQKRNEQIEWFDMIGHGAMAHQNIKNFKNLLLGKIGVKYWKYLAKKASKHFGNTCCVNFFPIPMKTRGE